MIISFNKKVHPNSKLNTRAASAYVPEAALVISKKVTAPAEFHFELRYKTILQNLPFTYIHQLKA